MDYAQGEALNHTAPVTCITPLTLELSKEFFQDELGKQIRVVRENRRLFELECPEDPKYCERVLNGHDHMMLTANARGVTKARLFIESEDQPEGMHVPVDGYNRFYVNKQRLGAVLAKTATPEAVRLAAWLAEYPHDEVFCAVALEGDDYRYVTEPAEPETEFDWSKLPVH